MSQQVNLYNPIFLRQKKIFSARTMLEALAVLAVGFIGFSAFAMWQVKTLEAEVARSEKRLKAEEARLTQAAAELAARRQSRELEQAVAKAQREVEMREALLGLMEKGVLGSPTGAAVYLRALARQHVEGLWLTGFESAGRELTLQGRALRAELLPEYLRRLGQEEALRGRSFTTLRVTRLPREAKEGQAKEAQPEPPWVEFVLSTTLPKESG